MKKENSKTNPRNQESLDLDQDSRRNRRSKRGIFSKNRKNEITKNKDEIKLN